MKIKSSKIEIFHSSRHFHKKKIKYRLWSTKLRKLRDWPLMLKIFYGKDSILLLSLNLIRNHLRILLTATKLRTRLKIKSSFNNSKSKNKELLQIKDRLMKN